MKLTSFNNLLAAAFVVSAAAGVAVSCQQTPTGPETPDPLDDTTEVIIPVSLERPINPDADSTTPDTRVTVNPTNGVTAWSEGDQIAIWIYNTGTSTGAYKTATVKDKAVSLAMSANEQRQGYAIYPASSWDGNATTVKVKYPDSYDMTGKDLSAANAWAPTPMVAINTEGDDLRFFHVGGLLRLHITDIPSGTTSLKVTFNGLDSPNYVAGIFSVNNPGTITASTTYATSDGKNYINFNNLTISDNEVYLNIPIPTISLSSLTSISVKNTGVSSSYTTQRDITGWSTIAHAQGKKATVSFVSISFLDGYDGTFNGGLILSPGILKYDGNSTIGSHGYTLTSGENPLELLDYYTQSSALNVYYHIWDTSGDDKEKTLKYRIDGNHDDTNIAGTIKIGDDVWRIPTSTEWTSILQTSSYTSKINSTTANGRLCKCHVDLSSATDVCGNDYSSKGLAESGFQDGVLLVPEYVSISCPGLNFVTLTAAFTLDNIPWSSLKKFIDAGCIFLPAAGANNGTEWYGGAGSLAYYWTATQPTGSNAYRVNVGPTSGSGSDARTKHDYTPVHLIKVVD